MTLVPGKTYKHEGSGAFYKYVGPSSIRSDLHIFETVGKQDVFYGDVTWCDAFLKEYKEPRTLDRVIAVWEDKTGRISSSTYFTEEAAKRNLSNYKVLEIIPFKWTEKV